MTLAEIDAKIRSAEQANAAVRGQWSQYLENIKREFGANSVEELQAIVEQRKQEAEAAQQTYQSALAMLEKEMKDAGL